jgi:cytochrome b pre-mRNA-processing protein 3
MLSFLFRGLTAQGASGAALFQALTTEARLAHWYTDGQVSDTLDGRFALLATVTALALVRLERDGEAGNQASVALTERFVEVMESEHRELGLGDPTLGKVVRKLVGMLARRTGLWRAAVAREADWIETTRESVYKEEAPEEAVAQVATGLRSLWERLDRATLDDLGQGRIT